MLPEVVRDTGEYLSVNTKNIVAVVVEAVKEMYGEMRAYMSRTEALEREVEALREEVEALRGRSLPIESAEPEPAPEEVTLDDEEETPVVPVEGPEPTVEASEPPAPSPAEIVE